jgi:hypothetical protein
MAQNMNERKWFSEETYDIVGRILAGTTEQAEEVLKSVKGYKPIPGLNMMTTPMVRRLIRNVKTRAVSMYGARCGVPRVKGKWETDDDSLVSISKYLREAGIDCDPSKGMKMVGCGPRNSRVNLYEPKGILAILYACATSRPRVDGKIRQVYGLETVEETPTEVIPAPSVETVTISPEFVKFLRALADAIEGGVK